MYELGGNSIHWLTSEGHETTSQTNTNQKLLSCKLTSVEGNSMYVLIYPI